VVLDVSLLLILQRTLAFASGDPLHSNAFLPCAALAFLVTTAN
jgi:hypothetical protein